MDGYRYWVERHKLLIALSDDKERVAARPDRERQQAEAELEADFRRKLDALYGEARDQFHTPPKGN
jgi:hypothetical protein